MKDFNEGEPLPLTVRTTVDVPAGSGMGGSSALVVALLDAYRRYLNSRSPDTIFARLAHDIERNDLQLAGGRQDQYAAAFGHFNFMEFYDQNRVIVNPLRMRDTTIQELEASLIVSTHPASPAVRPRSSRPRPSGSPCPTRTRCRACMR